MTTVPLSESVSIQLGAGGKGTASLGPLSAREIWHPASVHVQVSTDNNEAVCNIYVGDSPIQRCFRDATATGSLGDSTDRVGNDIVRTPDRIWAVWTGGDNKASATLTVVGSKDI